MYNGQLLAWVDIHRCPELLSNPVSQRALVYNVDVDTLPREITQLPVFLRVHVDQWLVAQSHHGDLQISRVP